MQQVKAQNVFDPCEPTYEVDQSLLFDKNAPNYLSRTFSGGNPKKWTFSIWLKSPTTFDTPVITRWVGTANQNYGQFVSRNNNFRVEAYKTSSWTDGQSSKVILDSKSSDEASWYHFVVRFDSAQANPEDRCRIYTNGIIHPNRSDTIYPPQNSDHLINSDGVHQIGAQKTNEVGWRGYMAEFNFVDNQSLGPEHFALTNPCGAYNPIPYTGTYGTTGFYLPFEASGIGSDHSGNNNNFTPSGLTSNSVVADSPTNNYSTFMPFSSWTTGTPINSTFSNGNRTVSRSSSGSDRAGQIETISFTTGKFWRAFHIDKVPTAQYDWLQVFVGEIAPGNLRPSNYGIALDNREGQIKYWDGAFPSAFQSGLAFTTGDTIGFAVDMDAGTVRMYKNGTFVFETDPAGWLPQTPNMAFGVQMYTYGDSAQVTISDEGAPQGYLPVCTNNLPTVSIKPEEHFKAVTYSGNGSTQSVSTGFHPDFVWLKSRNSSAYHRLHDSVRGGDGSRMYVLASNLTSAESTDTSVLSLSSDGFTTDNNAGGGGGNASGDNYISWNFKAGGPAVTNNDGSVSSQVSANKDMGFSVVKYSGSNPLATVGHGLGRTPAMIIIKSIDQTNEWAVGASAIADDWSSYLRLDDPRAVLDDDRIFNDTAPNSSVFTVGSFDGVNTTGEDYIAYCFANTDMVRVGFYNGNSSADGPFVALPFKPAYFLVKAVDSVQNWTVWDNGRDTYNISQKTLFPDINNYENDNASLSIDLLSNGVKVISSHTYVNYSGSRYLYLAIAEQPFKQSRGR